MRPPTSSRQPVIVGLHILVLNRGIPAGLKRPVVATSPYAGSAAASVRLAEWLESPNWTHAAGIVGPLNVVLFAAVVAEDRFPPLVDSLNLNSSTCHRQTHHSW